MSSTLTLVSLKQLIERENRLVVIDCYAEWCGPCKKISPVISLLEEKYNNGIVVVKVDIDECDDISNEYEIKSLPTILYFKKGDLIDKFIGANMKEIEKKIVTHC